MMKEFWLKASRSSSKSLVRELRKIGYTNRGSKRALQQAKDCYYWQPIEFHNFTTNQAIRIYHLAGAK